MKSRDFYGKVSGIIGIIINLILCSFKIVLGLILNTISITADGINNLTDCLSSIITIIGFHLAKKPADDEHPYGHGRIEYLSGLFISILIIIMGFETLKDSFIKIFQPTIINCDKATIIVLIISIIAKIVLGLLNRYFGNKINSRTIIAVSKDSFMDSFITFGILISIIISNYFSYNLDGYMGVLISIIVLLTGISSIKETINPLLGETIDKKTLEKIDLLIKNHKEILSYHNLLIHNYGNNKTYVSVHIEIPNNLTLIESHTLADNLENEINELLKCETIIHIDPI